MYEKIHLGHIVILVLAISQVVDIIQYALSQEIKMKYTDDQIAGACMKCVNDWDMDTLLQFAYDEMFHHYTEVASTAGLADFMQEMRDAD